MRGKRLVKLLTLVDLMSRPNGVSVREGMDALGLKDRKSFQRCREQVEDLGFPVYDDDPLPGERGKRWKFEEGYLKQLPNMSLPDFSLTQSDVMILNLLKAQTTVSLDTYFEKKIEGLFKRLNAFMPDGLASKLERISKLFILSDNLGKDYSGKEDIIIGLTDAMLGQKTCIVQYHSFSRDDDVSFKIDPLYFFERNGGLYIFSRATRFGDIRMLAVERIKNLEKSDESFDYPTDFDPKNKLDGTFGLYCDDPVSAKIWISPDQAKYVLERKFFRQQKIHEQEDGSLLLELETSGRWDVKSWVLSLGPNAELLEPDDLRKELAFELGEAKKKYA